MNNPEQIRKEAYQSLFDGMKYRKNGTNRKISDDLFESAGSKLEEWLEGTDNSEHIKEQYTAALAYYLAGQYARAYVIMKNPCESSILTSLVELLRMMFIKSLAGIQKSAFTVLEDEMYSDSIIAEKINRGEIDESEAIVRILWATLHRSFALLLGFIDNGQGEFLCKAIRLVEISSQLALERRMQEEWWIFRTASLMLQEFRENSLWVQLKPMLEEDTRNYVKRYIHALKNRETPVLELWRSQTIAVQPLNKMTERGRPSFCVKMPTGAGKTRIAELAILRFLMDSGLDSEQKCLYIAPFRSLAVQVETGLRQSFSPLGVRVSQLYGGFVINPAERLLFDDTRILIATPEKMDALLRVDQNLAQQIDLIIIDEGHIIDAGERGLSYEMFLHRLIQRFGKKGKRLVFMSAVIQNIEDFALWIAGTENKQDSIIESEWHVSKPILGIVQWDGIEGKSYYTHDTDLTPFKSKVEGYLKKFSSLSKDLKDIKTQEAHYQKSCINGLNLQGDFFETQSPKIPPKMDRHKFPENKSEIIALAGIQAVNDGSTLIFTCKPKHVERIAKAVEDALSIKEAIARYKEMPVETLPLPSKTGKLMRWQEWQKCIKFSEEMTGDSPVTKALKQGIIIHHGNIPKALRVNLEQLVRKGIIKLIIANNTLAQGVNLPVKTILIHSLHRDNNSKRHTGKKYQRISATDFWNICGRVGRAMQENQGYVFMLAADMSSNDNAEKNALKILNEYIRQPQGQKLESALKKFLQSVMITWSSKYPQATFPELCQHLADNKTDWLLEEDRRDLNVFDKHFIALLEELEEQADQDYVNPNRVQEIFERSLLFLQLPSSNEHTNLNRQTSLNLLTSRIKYLEQIPKSTRRRFYRTGLSLPDCQYIEENWETIEAKLWLAKDYITWDIEKRCDYVADLCKEVLFNLSDVKPRKKLPDCWLQIVKFWLMGETPTSIFEQLKASDSDIENVSQVTQVLDDMCDIYLPLGCNALYTYVQIVEDENILNPDVPEVVPYLSALIKYGVHSPVATILMSAGLEDRQMALKCAEHYGGVLEPSAVYNWINTLMEKDIDSWQTEPNVLEGMLNFLKSRNGHGQQESESLFCDRIQILTDGMISPLFVGMKLLVSSEPPNEIKLYTPAFDHLTTISIDDAGFFEKIASSRISAFIDDIRLSDESEYQEMDVSFV